MPAPSGNEPDELPPLPTAPAVYQSVPIRAVPPIERPGHVEDHARPAGVAWLALSVLGLLLSPIRLLRELPVPPAGPVTA